MSGERWPFCIVDVFTDRPLEGNQLAVFDEAADIPQALLQRLAREINFAETVYLYPSSTGHDARMRIFTPQNEIPFAGHPTLGTAAVIARRLKKDQVVLETGQGAIPVRFSSVNGSAMRGTMEQPIPTFTPYPHADELLHALGVSQSLLPITKYDNGLPHVFVILDRPAEVAAVEPDLAALARLARENGCRIVGFNVSAGAGAQWKTRMFAPADGVPEDAATGSAAGPLALHLARHGLVPWSSEIQVSQGAEIDRPSTLFARVSGDADRIATIEVGGFALSVGGGWFDGDLLRPSIAE